LIFATQIMHSVIMSNIDTVTIFISLLILLALKLNRSVSSCYTKTTSDATCHVRATIDLIYCTL
jgi:hypothetical protein